MDLPQYFAFGFAVFVVGFGAGGALRYTKRNRAARADADANIRCNLAAAVARTDAAADLPAYVLDGYRDRATLRSASRDFGAGAVRRYNDGASAGLPAADSGSDRADAQTVSMWP